MTHPKPHHCPILTLLSKTETKKCVTHPKPHHFPILTLLSKTETKKCVTHPKPHHFPILTLLSKTERTVFRHLIFIYLFLPARTPKAKWTRGNPCRLLTNSMSVNIKPEFDQFQSQLENDVTNRLTFINFPFIACFYCSSVIVKSKKMTNIECGRKIFKQYSFI